MTGTVSVRFTAVPWDQALDQILRMNRLGSVIDGTIVRIAPISVLSAEAEDRKKLADAQANEGDLRTLTKTLSYAKADDMAPLLVKSNTLSPRGTVSVDPRTNTLIVTDLQARLTAASDLMTTLDKPQPQVEIEARIVQTNKSYERAHRRAVGIRRQGEIPALGNTTPLAFPNSGTLTGAAAAAAVNGITAGRQSRGAGRHERRVARARLGERRLQSRRRAERARIVRQRAHPLDAARNHAEQRRSRNDAGRADPDSDRVEQHDDGHVQGRGAHASRGRRRLPRPAR